MPALLYVAATLLLVMAGDAQAQNALKNTGHVSGTVQSADSVPLPFAEVRLVRSGDSVEVAVTVTSANGSFRIEGVEAGSYRVEVSHLGYATVTRGGVALTDSVDRVDLGVIRLGTSAIALADVEVSARRAPIAFLPDRNVYSTGDMAAAASGTATDVLRSIPELEVSVEGSVTTRGARPSIHINGRPAPLQGEALDRYLQQLPASGIDRIEVIPNPSARYEAEGQGGIVNIVMKRGSNLGISGALTANAGTRNQKSASGRINYQEGRLTLFGGASFSFFGDRSENSDLRKNLSVEPVTYIQQYSRDRNSGGRANVDLAAEVKIGSAGTLWSEVGVSRNTSEARSLIEYTHMDHLRSPTERYDRSEDRDRRGLSGNGVIGFSRVDEGREWSIELRRNVNDSDDSRESARIRLDPDGTSSELDPELTAAGEGRDQSGFSVEAILKQGWGEAGQVEVGYRGSLRTSGDDFLMQVRTPDNIVPTDELLGDFRNRERIHAGFVTMNHRIGRFRVQAGVRAEQADVRRTLPLTGVTFRDSYSDLFPSVNVSTSVGSGGQLRLSYSKRVDRPSTGMLNPATPVLDPLNLDIGNPYLLPRHTHSFGLTGSLTRSLVSVQLSPFYRRTNDTWEQVRTVDEAGVSTVTWQNLATITSYGGSINVTLLPLGRVSGFVSVQGARTVRDASEVRAEFSGSSTRFSLTSNVNVSATSALSVQGSLTYLPAIDLPQGKISSMLFTMLGARQQLWGGRGSISLSVVDPFELQRFTFTTRDGTHVQIGSSTLSARRATLGISYNFGRPPKSGRRRSSEATEESEVRRIR